MRQPPRVPPLYSSAASEVYKRQQQQRAQRVQQAAAVLEQRRLAPQMLDLQRFVDDSLPFAMAAPLTQAMAFGQLP